MPNPKAGQCVLKQTNDKAERARKSAIACLFCDERKIACGSLPVGSVGTTCKYVGAPLVLIVDMGKLTFSLASAHGAHTSVNAQQ